MPSSHSPSHSVSPPPSPPLTSAIFRPLSTPAYTALTSSDSLSPTPPPPPPPEELVPSPTDTHEMPTSPTLRPITPLSPSSSPSPFPLPPLYSQDRSRDMSPNAPGEDATACRDDLGDDDSFTPDIVSGYHFNVPLALDQTASPAALNASRHTSTTSSDARSTSRHHVDLLPDLPDAKSTPSPPEHDHRTDAIYDDLDDIGDWIATSASSNPAADLTKRITRITSARPLSSSSTPATRLATAALHTHQRLDDRRRENGRDKMDRATVEQVLDPRTRLILFRLLSRNRLRTLDGCVSTGKEANVYYATAASLPDSLPDINGIYPPNPGLMAHDVTPDAPVAVKVFKTSILQFKDRERYVAGEFRFRRTGYQRSSNRKMVQQWAEKEFRNQMRLHEAGIPAPIPLLLKPPVLIMSFFGKDGWPAPRLKDASLSPAALAKAYFTVCMLMRRMFRVARLVHGDLSEYNMLYWNGDVVIIDVSQSVEDDHPMALDFLRRDCANVNDFFRRSGVVAVLGVRELFDFITGERIGSSKEDQENALTYLLEAAATRKANEQFNIQRNDEVFLRSYIPRSLQEIEVQEQHLRRNKSDEVDSNLFTRLTGFSLTQKRERRVLGSKVTSIGETSSVDVGEAVVPRCVATLGDEGEMESRVDPPNLAETCVEPTTSRLPLKEEQIQIRTSSPCTSNSSLRQHAEERESRRSKCGRIDSTWDQAAEDYDDDDDCDGGHGQADDDTFDANAESDTDDDDEDDWVRKSRGESPDPFKGLTKKEWKKKVKAEARERREHKVPKHVKKRKETLAKRRRGTK